MNVVEIINGREVVVDREFVDIDTFLDRAIVTNKDDIERILKMAEAWERVEHRQTSVALTVAEHKDLRRMIAASNPNTMRLVSSEPVKAISHQRTIEHEPTPNRIDNRTHRRHD
jgi:hypothetical protein